MRGQNRRQGGGQGHPLVIDHSRLHQGLIIERDRETYGKEREGEQEALQAHPVLLHQGRGVQETGGSGLLRPGHILHRPRVTSLTEKVTQGVSATTVSAPSILGSSSVLTTFQPQPPASSSGVTFQLQPPASTMFQSHLQHQQCSRPILQHQLRSSSNLEHQQCSNLNIWHQ